MGEREGDTCRVISPLDDLALDHDHGRGALTCCRDIVSGRGKDKVKPSTLNRHIHLSAGNQLPHSCSLPD